MDKEKECEIHLQLQNNYKIVVNIFHWSVLYNKGFNAWYIMGFTLKLDNGEVIGRSQDLLT